MPTIKDVAKAAQVSFKTVSRVINTPQEVSKEKRDRVLKAIEELGFQPNLTAQLMRNQKSNSIGFITDLIASTPHAVEIINGAQTMAWSAKKVLLIVNTNERKEVQREAIKVIQERKMEGLIYANMTRWEFSQFPDVGDLRLVLLNCSVRGGGTPAILPNDYEGGYRATEICIQRGHQRIGFINIFPELIAAKERLKGYQEALKHYQIPFDEKLVVNGFMSYQFQKTLVMKITEEFLALPKPPTAIFCGNDQIAMGVYEVLKARGIKIPEEMGVIGFDNEEFIAENLSPGLSTMALPHFKMGQLAVEYLLNPHLQQNTSTVYLDCPFVERESI